MQLFTSEEPCYSFGRLFILCISTQAFSVDLLWLPVICSSTQSGCPFKTQMCKNGYPWLLQASYGSVFPAQGHRTGAWSNGLFMALVSCSLWGLKGTYLYTKNNNKADEDSSAHLQWDWKHIETFTLNLGMSYIFFFFLLGQSLYSFGMDMAALLHTVICPL